MPQNTLGRAAAQGIQETMMTCRWHGDQIDLLLVGCGQYDVNGIAMLQCYRENCIVSTASKTRRDFAYMHQLKMSSGLIQ